MARHRPTSQQRLARLARLEALVPDYVSNRIGAADRAWIESLASSDEHAREIVSRHRELRVALAQRYANVDDDIGLAGLMARVSSPAPSPMAHSASWLMRLRDTLQRLGERIGGPQLAYGAAALLLVAPTAVFLAMIAGAPERVDDAALGSVRSAVISAGDESLRIRFKPDATERELRMTLTGVGARIIDGPDQLGDYLITASPERLPAVREALATSALVERVEPTRGSLQRE